MRLSSVDASSVFAFLLGNRGFALLRSFGFLTAAVKQGAAYFVLSHIRLSTFFYGSGLTLITGVDLQNGKTALVYVLSAASCFKVSVMCVIDVSAYSIVSLYPNASWYEREVSEFLGVSFTNSEDTRTLLMPYNDRSNPLKKQQTTAGASALLNSRRHAALRWFSL